MARAEIYEFGELTLNAAERRLSKSDVSIPLAPKVQDLLLALVRNAGRLVTKHELLQLVWPDSYVDEGILAVHVSALRKALGQDADRPYIETVSRSGYRFVATVTQPSSDLLESGKPYSLAVLPARPFSGEIIPGRDRSVSLALTDALIDRLGRSHEVIVRPARAVRPYIHSSEDPAAIGRALRVDAVIDWRLLGTPDRVRLSVHLIRSLDGAALWNGSFDESPTSLIAVADVIAECVLTHLGSNSQGLDGAKGRLPPGANPEVYELLGRGRFHLLAASMFELPKAIEAFRAAIEIDPTYAASHAHLACAYCAQAFYRLVPPGEAYSQAKAAALRALAMDDANADAQVALGAVLFFSEWNWVGAERSLKRALQLNPNHSEGYLQYGELLEALGKLEEGLRMKLRALERDPFSPLVHLQISLSYWHQRRYDESIEWANKTLELDPRHPHAREHLAGAYWKKGDVDRHMEQNLKHAEIHGVPEEVLERLKRTFAAEGRAGMLKMALQRASREPQAFPAMQLALFHGEAGDMDAAFHHLERAIESHDPGLVYLAVGPQWDTLRGDERFSQYLLRMGLSG